MEFIVNEDKNRFELHTEGYIAFIDYVLKDDVMFLIHTEVPRELGGKGIGKDLVKRTLEYLKEKEYKLNPVCSFIENYVQKNFE